MTWFSARPGAPTLPKTSTCSVPVSMTLPSHMSLLTGLDPFAHGIRPAVANDNQVRVLAPRSPVLAEVLRDSGYQTLGLADNANVMTLMGFGRGFDTFDNVRTTLRYHG